MQQHRVDRAAERLGSDPEFSLFADAICNAAATYWDGLDESDFCLQHVGYDVIVFGSTNRLLYSPTFGFRPDRTYCTQRFLANYDRVGPVPMRSR